MTARFVFSLLFTALVASPVMAWDRSSDAVQTKKLASTLNGTYENEHASPDHSFSKASTSKTRRCRSNPSAVMEKISR